MAAAISCAHGSGAAARRSDRIAEEALEPTRRERRPQIPYALSGRRAHRADTPARLAVRRKLTAAQPFSASSSSPARSKAAFRSPW